MISISKYISEPTDELTVAKLRVPYTVLETLVAHSVNYDAEEYAKNRANLRKLRGDLESAKTSTDVLQATGAIVRAIEAYNRSVARYIEARAEERHTVVGMLMGKLRELAEGKGKAAENLRLIGQQLDKASRAGDVKVLRKELAESLRGVQQEAAEQQEQAAAIASQTHELMAKIGLPAVPPADSDPATGLPGLRTAELAIQQAIGSHVHAYVVLFTVSLGIISRRYGHDHDDGILASFAKQIAPNLGADDLMFRWKGHTLVALLERPDSNDAAPPEMSKMASFQPEFVLEIDGKSTKVQLPMSSISFRLWKYESLDAVRHVLDQCQQAVAPDPVQKPAAPPAA